MPEITVNVAVIQGNKILLTKRDDFVNPVSLTALTDGAIPASGSCEKLNTNE